MHKTDQTILEERHLILPRNEQQNRGALWLGNAKAAQNLANLQNDNITYIQSALQPNSMRDVYAALLTSNITQRVFDFGDTHITDVLQFFEESGDFINRALQNGNNILVHCMQGISRAPTLVCAYQIKYHKMDPPEALRFVKKIRAKVNPNQGFKTQLMSWYIIQSSYHLTK